MSVLYHDIINGKLLVKDPEQLEAERKAKVLKPLSDDGKRKDWLADPCTQQLLEVLQQTHFDSSRALVQWTNSSSTDADKLTVTYASRISLISDLVILIKEGKENK